MTSPEPAVSPDLRCASVLRVEEDACEVWTGGRTGSLVFAPSFPRPRTERVRPGHLVALATAPDGRGVVVWRWFDAVVLEASVLEAGEPGVRLWEPAHGEVVARLRHPTRQPEPGSRVYASSGLPGAGWWVAGPLTTSPEDADVELEAVAALYAALDLWPSTIAT